jgi:hypothetical protein
MWHSCNNLHEMGRSDSNQSSIQQPGSEFKSWILRQVETVNASGKLLTVPKLITQLNSTFKKPKCLNIQHHGATVLLLMLTAVVRSIAREILSLLLTQTCSWFLFGAWLIQSTTYVRSILVSPSLLRLRFSRSLPSPSKLFFPTTYPFRVTFNPTG